MGHSYGLLLGHSYALLTSWDTYGLLTAWDIPMVY